MTCKDCIHFSLCDYNTNNSVTIQKVNLIYDEGAESCSFFKDRSKIIELPCKVGETIFVLDNDNIQKRKVIGVEYLYFVDDTKHHYNIVVSDGCGHIDIKFNCVGRDVFLTKESAEQALREKKCIS